MTELSGVDPPYPCPCCGYLTSSGAGSYDICPICFWEDDLVQLRFPGTAGGANDASLIEAQATFIRIGACEEGVLPHVRGVTAADRRDPAWRPIDPTRDTIERPAQGFGYGGSYPKDSTRLYYWRPNYWHRPRA